MPARSSRPRRYGSFRSPFAPRFPCVVFLSCVGWQPPSLSRRRSRFAAPAAAQELKIAVAADVTSIDPHFFNLFPNNNIAEHIFDKLVQMDPDSQMIPGLATSWKTIDDKTWEFKLRKGVKFHDGSELTAEDVVFSIDRVPLVPNSPGPFTAYTKAIVAKEIVDPYTIRFKYAAPYPLAPNDLSTIYIVSKKVAANATTEDFNSGKAAIGSGRYKFVRYVNGDRIDLVRNDNYWGDKPAYDKVKFKIIKNEPARMAALLSGDVDAIEQPPTADMARLKTDPKFTLTSKISHRVIYFNFDHLTRVEPVHHRQGRQAARQESAARRARAPRDVQGDQPARDRRARDGRPGDSVRPARVGKALRPHTRRSRPRSTIPKAPRSCLPRPAIRTASTSRSTAPPAAMSTTRRSCRRWRRCWRASASRPRSRPRRWGRTRPAHRSRSSASTWWAGARRPAKRRRRCARCSRPSTATRDWAR